MRLDLSDQALMTIMAALGNHPYREAAPAIMELQRQINAQMPREDLINANGHDRHRDAAGAS